MKCASFCKWNIHAHGTPCTGMVVQYVVVTQRPHICEMNHLKWLKVIMGIRRFRRHPTKIYTQLHMCDARRTWHELGRPMPFEWMCTGFSILQCAHNFIIHWNKIAYSVVVAAAAASTHHHHHQPSHMGKRLFQHFAVLCHLHFIVYRSLCFISHALKHTHVRTGASARGKHIQFVKLPRKFQVNWW